jgi:DNA-binding response OmpR family regulator
VRHILVVDDDPAIREVVADILALADYGVKTASNGVEALEDIRTDPPAAVLLDLMMPVMDGWEFLRQFRADTLWAAVPVAIMSAARDGNIAASELGAQAFLPKPFDLDAVLTLVERLIS